MNYAKLARTVAVLGLLYLLVVGLCDAGLNAQESQSLGAVGVSISGQKRHNNAPAARWAGATHRDPGRDRITAINGRPMKQVEESELIFRRTLGEDLRLLPASPASGRHDLPVSL